MRNLSNHVRHHNFRNLYVSEPSLGGHFPHSPRTNPFISHGMENQRDYNGRIDPLTQNSNYSNQQMFAYNSYNLNRWNFQFDFLEILKTSKLLLVFKFSEFLTDSWAISVYMGNYTTEPPEFEQRILQARNAHQTTRRRQQYLRNLIQLNIPWISDDYIDKLVWWDHFPSPVGPQNPVQTWRMNFTRVRGSVRKQIKDWK